MARRNHGNSGTTVKVEKAAFIALAKKHEQFKRYAEHWRFNEKSEGVEISMDEFELDSAKTLLKAYQDLPAIAEDDIIKQEERKETLLHLSTWIKVLEDPKGARVAKLRPLERAIIEFLKVDAKRMWLFQKREDGSMQPYLVTGVRYYPLEISDRTRIPAHVTIYTSNWSQGRSSGGSTTYHLEDLKGGRTVEELLLGRNLYKETDALLANYDKGEAQFLDWRQQMGEQYVGDGEFEAQGSNRWSSDIIKVKGIRFIINDRCDEIKADADSSLFKDEEVTPRIPLEFYIWCFNLNSYDNGWIHMRHLKPYQYRPELRNKLILPAEHGDLIDALTADMNVLMEDIVSGKSGGTAILCQGRAGTGKTLTAEVYAECIKRPLYRVHSGQLGTDADSVEKALKVALDNAKRWRAVLLIDEADVFVSVRGGDLDKNAVIGVFLRVLEYYDGLLFMTTNRVDDIDEAILSRCIAVIKYDIPGVEERERIWLTLGGVYGMDLIKDKKMAKQLAENFPKASGRDIKGLIKLVTKYARQRNKKVEIDDFKRMAAFRGL